MKVREPHEADTLRPLHVCPHELGGGYGSLLLHHWKEGRLVDEQVFAQTQDLTHTNLPVEVVRDLERFNALAPEWDTLVDTWGIDRVFLSHSWFRTWWESFAADNELFVVTVRDRGEMVAIAPMMRTRASIYGVKLDTIQAIYNPHTPRYDFIVAGNYDRPVYRAIWKVLIENGGADAVVLTQIPHNSRTISRMREVGKEAEWLIGEWPSHASPYISLADGYEAFFGNLKNGAQYNLTKRYARLRKKGAVDIEIISNPADVNAALSDGLRIEAAAWKGRAGTAIISDPTVADFYIRLARREANLGRLRLAFLRFCGKRIAFNYLIRSGKKLYGIKIGYDPDYHMYSPGNMLLNLILQRACTEGIEEYDFLGIDDQWKFEWTSEKVEHRWLFLFRNRLSMRLLHYLKFRVLPAVKPRLKSIYT
jgi:CelD/BcsL family acetyltransferase involved in cellulose biosynthesis